MLIPILFNFLIGLETFCLEKECKNYLTILMHRASVVYPVDYESSDKKPIEMAMISES